MIKLSFQAGEKVCLFFVVFTLFVNNCDIVCQVEMNRFRALAKNGGSLPQSLVFQPLPCNLT